MQRGDIYQEFAKLGESPGHQIDVASVALLVAATEYPLLDIEAELGVLDSLAAGAPRLPGDGREPLVSVNNLSEYLFDEIGFRGNKDDYYDQRNSFLNDVLSRRLGIPITLSLVYIEVGRRLGVPLVGVGMPGHFLVMHQREDDLFIDPFEGGILLSKEECAQRFRDATQAEAPWDSRYLAPVSNRDFVARIIRNLKTAFLRRQDDGRALTMIDLLLALQPDASHERRDRGLVHYRLGHYGEALDDLRDYLEATPQDPNRASLEGVVGQLRGLL